MAKSTGESTVKATFEITTNAKFHLSTLKAQLRLAGHNASEASIVEHLIKGASLGELASEYTKAARRKKR